MKVKMEISIEVIKLLIIHKINYNNHNLNSKTTM
jgi:hypothetical protein